MKKKKLRLNTLKVNSFLTAISEKEKVTVKGGDIDSADGECTGSANHTEPLNCLGGSNYPCPNPPQSGQFCPPGGGGTPPATNACPPPPGGSIGCSVGCSVGFSCFPGDGF